MLTFPETSNRTDCGKASSSADPSNVAAPRRKTDERKILRKAIKSLQNMKFGELAHARKSSQHASCLTSRYICSTTR